VESSRTAVLEPPEPDRFTSQTSHTPPAKELESQGPEALLARCKPGRDGIRPSQIDLLLQVQKTHGNRAVQRMLQRAHRPLKAVLFSKPHSITQGTADPGQPVE
jgi:hypothetical protein